MGLQEHLWKKFKHDSSGVQKLGKAMKEDISIVLPSTCISEKKLVFFDAHSCRELGYFNKRRFAFRRVPRKTAFLFCFETKQDHDFTTELNGMKAGGCAEFLR